MLELHNISKKYGSLSVLEGVSLRLAPGEVHGIVGENGAGKTTLFRCIAGLEDHEGEVSYSPGKLKDTTGFLAAEPYFLPKITGDEYLRLHCLARNIDMSGFNRANIFDLPLGRFAESYSTGMKKKLAITAILLQKNNVVLLDEPFNGIDLRSNMILMEIILRLRDLGKIVLISSHIFSILNDACDFIHVLGDGRILRTAGKEDFTEVEDSLRENLKADVLEKLSL